MDGNPPELIDRFVVNVASVGTSQNIKTISGIFGYAEIDLSLRVICADNFYGPNCDVFCVENCTCPPGFTGEFCATSIDDCVGVECGENQRCVDAHLNYTCVCEAGYTGPDCLTDIDECEGVNCNSGTCVEGVGFFRCECPPRYTGQFCETQLDSYQLQVTIHSFNNPDGRCAECNADTCCEGVLCPNSCHYFFSLCLRPAGTPVSMVRDDGQGNCSALTTEIQLLSNGRSFADYFLGIPNPIKFEGRQWVSQTEFW